MIREFASLDIGALGQLDKGRVGVLFETAMERVIEALQDDDVERSGGFASGSITIKISLDGRRANEGGDINAVVSVVSSVPKPLSARASLTNVGGKLAFDVTPDAQAELPILRSVSK